MASEVTVALITGGVAIAVSLASFPLNYLIGMRARQAQTQDLMARYRGPLLWAVHDLRSRIRTILDEEFLQRYLVNGDDFMRPYARRHTTFVLAQYLGWVEIARRDIGFFDLGDRRSNRKVVELLSIIRRVLFAVDLDGRVSRPAPVVHTDRRTCTFNADSSRPHRVLAAQDHLSAPPGHQRLGLVRPGSTPTACRPPAAPTAANWLLSIKRPTGHNTINLRQNAGTSVEPLVAYVWTDCRDLAWRQGSARRPHIDAAAMETANSTMLPATSRT
jgi:hypothetical protein